MTIPVHHVNASDARFMREMIVLLRKGVRDGVLADEMASDHSGDPQLRLLAQKSSGSAARQINAMVSCLDDWNAETRPRGLRARIETPVEAPPSATAEPTDYGDELADLHGALFDARVTQNLLVHHRAVIARSRQEMIEGLNTRSRAFARDAISQHSGDLRLLEAG
ncbi:uncharacterized protein (DUF305 family) [Nocardioides soli]|uniref:Uncharacterized protein (DUF305 family) n=2 Tax=Nocardioides soli TaxID=1036020 RepID=A0A7W4VWF7_9ACTN|nr:uncharacterized protein (DUF305 family) [Nocardioides soli]